MASPPVVRFLDFGQYKYELTKREKEAKRKQRSVTFKEVRLKPKIGGGDFDTKVRRAIEFLEEGDRIKVSVQFRGRELTHPEIGRNLLAQFTDRSRTTAWWSALRCSKASRCTSRSHRSHAEERRGSGDTSANGRRDHSTNARGTSSRTTGRRSGSGCSPRGRSAKRAGRTGAGRHDDRTGRRGTGATTAPAAQPRQPATADRHRRPLPRQRPIAEPHSAARRPRRRPAPRGRAPKLRTTGPGAPAAEGPTALPGSRHTTRTHRHRRVEARVPKMKSHKGAQKRVGVTGTGKPPREVLARPPPRDQVLAPHAPLCGQGDPRARRWPSRCTPPAAVPLGAERILWHASSAASPRTGATSGC